MKILFLARYINTSGVSTHMLTLAKELIAAKNSVALLTGGENDKSSSILLRQFSEIGVKVLKVPFPTKRTNKFIEFLHYLISIPVSIIKISKYNPDILHVHWPVTSYIAEIYKLIRRKPFVITFHSEKTPKTILHRKGDGAIAVSSDLYNEIKQRFDYLESKLFLIHNGVYSSIFSPGSSDQKLILKDKYGLDKSKLIVTFVGSFSVSKGIDLLIEACTRIRASAPDFQLLLVGAGDQDWIRKLIFEKKAESFTKIIPFQKHPEDIYKISDIFVLPSRKEAFPLVVIEAMMAGVPVIRSNTGGAKDQINHGEDGFIFESEDINALSEHLKYLLNNPQARLNIGENGREKALRFFTQEKMTAKTMDAYIQIIETYKKRGKSSKKV